MILGAVSLIDCLVFVSFLAPQLLYHVGLIRSAFVAIKALPYLGQSQKTIGHEAPYQD